MDKSKDLSLRSESKKIKARVQITVSKIECQKRRRTWAVSYSIFECTFFVPVPQQII